MGFKLSNLKKLAATGARAAVKAGIARAGGVEGIQNYARAALAPRLNSAIASGVARAAGMRAGGVVVVRVMAKKKRAVRRRRA
jgi:hypothetical protein